MKLLFFILTTLLIIFAIGLLIILIIFASPSSPLGKLAEDATVNNIKYLCTNNKTIEVNYLTHKYGNLAIIPVEKDKLLFFIQLISASGIRYGALEY